MSFAQVEMLSHQLGRRVAQHLDREMTDRQSGLYSDDYCCPPCGLECEAIKHKRTIDGETEVVELKSYCPKCRRKGAFLHQVSQLRQGQGDRHPTSSPPG